MKRLAFTQVEFERSFLIGEERAHHSISFSIIDFLEIVQIGDRIGGVYLTLNQSIIKNLLAGHAFIYPIELLKSLTERGRKISLTIGAQLANKKKFEKDVVELWEELDLPTHGKYGSDLVSRMKSDLNKMVASDTHPLGFWTYRKGKKKGRTILVCRKAPPRKRVAASNKPAKKAAHRVGERPKKIRVGEAAETHALGDRARTQRPESATPTKPPSRL